MKPPSAKNVKAKYNLTCHQNGGGWGDYAVLVHPFDTEERRAFREMVAGCIKTEIRPYAHDWGEAGCIRAVIKPGVELPLETVLAYLGGKLAKYKLPLYVYCME
ncbi:hypothetical protein [Robiginitomaculum antarcticum]|uniref:hypothetical protein n=1 Tax=Robiginitomaculum antarcticum TaxID=437507 RepID=UPI00035C407A|nr:hypothetical protein [Robiginitomaculum antarcticum]